MKCFQLALWSSLIVLNCLANEENTTLLLVQTIFRHGDRAPKEAYPFDLNSEDIWINGLGQLTQLGKQQLYNVGKYLRTRYNDFITADPKEIIVKSASQKRCLNSAEAYLASFYSPEEMWKFTNDLNWQPIPIRYKKKKKNRFWDHRTDCAQIHHAWDTCFESERFQTFYKKYETVIDHLTNISGIDLSVPMNGYHLCNTFEVEKSHNLSIPDWAETHWKEIKFISNEVYRCFTFSDITIRLAYGSFMGLVTKHLQRKLNGKDPDLKFVINSSHGVNLSGVLRALNFTEMPEPPFAATIVFELHEMADFSKAVRLLYLNSTNPAIHIEEPHVLVLEGCSEFCPVEYFMKSYEYLIPDNWKKECKLKTNDKHTTSGSQFQTRPVFEKYIFFLIFIFFLFTHFLK